MLENGVLECLKSTMIQRVKARIQQELQGVKTQIKMPELKDDGVVENKSLGLQLKMMTVIILGIYGGLNERINSQRMG
jgi:hypothetical protein